MSLAAHFARFATSLLLIAAAGSVTAAGNTNALLGASDSAVLELGERSIARPALASTKPIASATGLIPMSVMPTGMTPAKAAPKRLPNKANEGFDWSTLISLGFGIVGLMWVRRRTADL